MLVGCRVKYKIGVILPEYPLHPVLVGHIREVTGKPVGIKTVFGSDEPFRELFALINERGPDSAPDFITIDGGEGGTGAAPMPLMDLVGVSVGDRVTLLGGAGAQCITAEELAAGDDPRGEP